MNPNVIVAGVKIAATTLSMLGVSQIVSSVATTYTPTPTILRKVIVTAGAWGMAAVVNEKTGPSIEREIDKIANAAREIKAQIDQKASEQEK